MTSVPFTRSQVFRRYRTVLRVLSRHGLGVLAEQLGIAGLRLPKWFPGSGSEIDPSRGEQLRRAFEELGPAFVKLGQMLSTRADLLPPDVVSALEQLQDQVAPVPFEQIRTVLEEELGAPLEQRFQSIAATPVAAASLGQVHEAVLANGQPVVIKVQRPGVQEQVELDLQVLIGLATMAARRSQRARHYDILGVAHEFASMLRGELDYRQEGRNADRFRTNFAQDEWVYVPLVHWEQTTGRVLTLERVGGLKVTDRQGMIQAGLEPPKVAERLAGAIFRMVLRDGFFHADPHPGNLFITPEGRIIFIDLGMVGELTPAMRSHVVDYVIGVVGNDPDKVVQAILQMGVMRGRGNRTALRWEVERLQQKYGEIPLSQVQFGPALREILAMARRYQISFPSGYTALLKAMTTLEAVARQVDPHATMVGLAAPYAELVLQGRLQPERLLERLGRDLIDAGRHTVRIPRQVSRVFTLLEEGELKIAIDHTGLELTMLRLSRIVNRLAIAILLASLIIGTALVAARGEESFLQRYPIADVGFVLIGAVGLWLVWSILASQRTLRR